MGTVAKDSMFFLKNSFLFNENDSLFEKSSTFYQKRNALSPLYNFGPVYNSAFYISFCFSSRVNRGPALIQEPQRLECIASALWKMWNIGFFSCCVRFMSKLRSLLKICCNKKAPDVITLVLLMLCRGDFA